MNHTKDKQAISKSNNTNWYLILIFFTKYGQINTIAQKDNPTQENCPIHQIPVRPLRRQIGRQLEKTQR